MVNQDKDKAYFWSKSLSGVSYSWKLVLKTEISDAVITSSKERIQVP